MSRTLSFNARTDVPEARHTRPYPKPSMNVRLERKEERIGLLCTDEFEAATARCRKKVETIIRDCRARNSRFRDIEFDLEADRNMCLYALNTGENVFPEPADVLRVTEIFEEPRFFVGTPSSSSFVQGALRDGWFLSAVSTVAAMGLINRICVHRDEEVGVYGFVFYRNSDWVDVIVDDFLFTRIPKYEELWPKQKDIYHNDKETYESRARIGGDTLLFSKSTTENETWVSLLEKAYAKFNGDYEALIGGYDTEGIEALTGGISTIISTKDILDTNRFWKTLLNSNRDQLFGCSIDNSKASQITGLFTGQSYSVLEALEVNGKRFVRVRNPWGQSEWKGPWSDGSKEWTHEWITRLPELRHRFGDDGEFLMEYKDFLKTWSTIERSRLFSEDWKLSTMWLNVTLRALPTAWSFGDVSFTFSLAEDSPTAIALSQLNTRSFDDISGRSEWSLDFVIYRKGASSDEPCIRSYHTLLWQGTASVELDNLEAGEYVLHVRLDRKYYAEESFSQGSLKYWEFRKLGRLRTRESISKSIAANFEPAVFSGCIPTSDELLGGQGLQPIPLKDTYVGFQAPHPITPNGPYHWLPADNMPRPLTESPRLEGSPILINSPYSAHSPPLPESVPLPNSPPLPESIPLPESPKPESPVLRDREGSNEGTWIAPGGSRNNTGGPVDANGAVPYSPIYGNMGVGGTGSQEIRQEPVTLTMAQLELMSLNIHGGFSCNECKASPIQGFWYRCLDPSCLSYNICDECLKAKRHSHDNSHKLLLIQNTDDSRKLKQKLKRGAEDSVTLGLRIYTKGESVVMIKGQLRHGSLIAPESED